MKQAQQEFEQWWSKYPRKVGKLAAQQAYQRARKLGATQDELLAGVEAYIQHKPAYADWCHAVTFLRQGRWMDSYDTPAVAPPASLYWADECQQVHGGTCAKAWDHAMRMRADRAESA